MEAPGDGKSLSEANDEVASDVEGTTAMNPVSPVLADQLKSAYDRACARLAEQRGDLTTLQGRAKDLLGFATLAAGVGKLVSSEPYLTFSNWTAYAVLCAVAVLAASAMFVLWPRKGWRWGLDAAQAKVQILTPFFPSLADLYAAGVDDMVAMEQSNERRIRCRKIAVWIAIIAFSIESIALVWAAVGSGQSVDGTKPSDSISTTVVPAPSVVSSSTTLNMSTNSTIVTVPGQ